MLYRDVHLLCASCYCSLQLSPPLRSCACKHAIVFNYFNIHVNVLTHCLLNHTHAFLTLAESWRQSGHSSGTTVEHMSTLTSLRAFHGVRSPLAFKIFQRIHNSSLKKGAVSWCMSGSKSKFRSSATFRCHSANRCVCVFLTGKRQNQRN